MIEKFARPQKQQWRNPKQAKFLLFQRLLNDDVMVFPLALKEEVSMLVQECAEKYGRKPRAKIIFK